MIEQSVVPVSDVRARRAGFCGGTTGWGGGVRSKAGGSVRRVSDELLFGDVDVDEDDGPAVRIVEERPPLREGKVFVDYGERVTISENLEAAYVALNQAFRGIWIEKCLEHGQVREYWDEGDIDEVETLTLEARTAVERVWRALSDVVDAHTAQCEADYPAEVGE